ncbi:carbohydrate kinase [Pseudoalteromonas sp. YIC-656]|uniref:carbohydrate kinase family protein n=1 Tax=Pseudoalteromonas pernae TaxID=3118054 RepID=UPI003242D0E9
MFSLLSYGEVLVDFLPGDDTNTTYLPLAGGAPANVAVAYAKLGGHSYFAGGISRDTFGEHLYNELKSYGVDATYTARIADANTAIVLVSLDPDGERHFNFYRNDTADTRYQQKHIDLIDWQTIGIFHFCSNTLTTQSMYLNTVHAINRSKDNQVCVSFDVNLRQQLWQEAALLPARVDECLRLANIVKLSRDEANYLAQYYNEDAEKYVSRLLGYGVNLIVVTDGPRAVHLYSKLFTANVPVPVITPVDTTAAGDSFIGAFLFYLSQHLDNKDSLFTHTVATQNIMLEAVKFAAQCGAKTCQRKGAFGALPSLEEIG